MVQHCSDKFDHPKIRISKMNLYYSLILFISHLYFADLTSTPVCDVYRFRDVDNVTKIGHQPVLSKSLLPPLESERYTKVNTIDEPCPCGGKFFCLRKCCFQQYSFSLTSKKCVNSSAPSSVSSPFTKPGPGSLVPTLSTSNESKSRRFVYVYGFPCSTINPVDLSYLEVVENETVYIDGSSFEPHEYCVEYFLELERYSLLHCIRPEMATTNFRVLLGFICTEVFLFLTLIIYSLLDNLKNLLPTKILLSYIVSLMITYGDLIALRIQDITGETFCTFSTFVVQFSFLASFFWLNVMCFDLWCTFSGYRSFNGSLKERDLKKFLAYCLYAWGCPTLIVAVTVFVEFYPYLPENFIKPKFGKTKCFFETDEAVFLYFYSFISIILVSNLCMFISTAVILKKHEKEVKVFKRSGSKRHLENDKQRFNLYIKLFVVMGVNWIMDVVSFYIREPAILFFITDIINMLQGVLIFIIFVCKRRIFLLLKKKLFDKKETLGRQRTRNFSTTTSVISLTSMRGGSSVTGVAQPKTRQTSVC